MKGKTPGRDGPASSISSTGTAASPARLATAEFRVSGMTCGGCALATEMAVKKLDGVPSADALQESVLVPDHTGRRSFEFTADNAGHWFFHCHDLYHLEAGMAREASVG